MRNSLLNIAFAAVLLVTGTAAAHGQNLTDQQMLNALLPKPGAAAPVSRGFTPLSPSDSAPVAPSAAPQKGAAAPTSAAPASAVSLNVQFVSGSAELTPEAMTSLDQLGRVLGNTQLASFSFSIIGHTDTVGDAATNQALSEARAQAVKTYLEQKFGISDVRLQAKGVGETDLAVATPPGVANFANRRVEVVNLGE
jgi:outer membrane protein OmpA-like peptidoglycan-associated protein